jgi:hypothetical protein
MGTRGVGEDQNFEKIRKKENQLYFSKSKFKGLTRSCKFY